MRFLLRMIHLSRYNWHQILYVIGEQRIVRKLLLIQLRIVSLCQNVLKHLFFRQRTRSFLRICSFQYSLIILLRWLSLGRRALLILLECCCNVILHIFSCCMLYLLLSLLTSLLFDVSASRPV